MSEKSAQLGMAFRRDLRRTRSGPGPIPITVLVAACRGVLLEPTHLLRLGRRRAGRPGRSGPAAWAGWDALPNGRTRVPRRGFCGSAETPGPTADAGAHHITGPSWAGSSAAYATQETSQGGRRGISVQFERKSRHALTSLNERPGRGSESPALEFILNLRINSKPLKNNMFRRSRGLVPRCRSSRPWRRRAGQPGSNGPGSCSRPIEGVGFELREESLTAASPTLLRL